MNYAMLTTLIPNEQSESFKQYSRHVMQDAASVLQWNLYQGFCTNLQQEILLINVLPVGSFPQYYKYPFIRASRFDPTGINIGFCNVKLLRNIHKERQIYKALMRWCLSTAEDKTLFVYTVSQPFLKAVAKVKSTYPSLKVCAIVADLPDMANLSSKRGILQKIYVERCAEQAYGLLSCVDSFVLLTKHMASYMQIYQPYCVMEGIASSNGLDEIKARVARKCKNIVYTGTLHRKFGVLHLLEAFRALPDPDARLIICGIGDSEAEIRQASQEDSRIEYRGQQPREAILQLQQEATVLVNPRQNNEVFTKYSFPSKTMEYLAAGVPVIAYKLDGIPDEYDKYLLYPHDDSVIALTNVMQNVCAMDAEERARIGQAGREYVLTYKNPVVQTKRILEFLLNSV